MAVGAIAVQAQADPVVTIMPLGDSLTWGYDGNPADLTTLDTGGYRSPMYLALGADGVDVSYVGVDNGNPSPVLTAAGQTAQNGFNGYRLGDIANNLAGSVAGSDGVSNDGGYWLTGGGGTGRGPATPNIILLQIGANDIEQGYDPLYTGAPGTEPFYTMAADLTTELETLINQIMYYDPNAWIFTDGTSPLVNDQFADYSSSVYEQDTQAMIAADFAGKNVYYVNMHDAIVNSNSFFGNYTGDGVHLDAQGYTVMGDTWAAAIMADYNFDDAASAPEPSTWALLAGGGLALLGWRRFARTR